MRIKELMESIVATDHHDYVFGPDDWTYNVHVKFPTDSGIPELYTVTISSNKNQNKKFGGNITIMRSNRYMNPNSPKGKKLIAAAIQYLKSKNIEVGV